jgi:TonB family protein
MPHALLLSPDDQAVSAITGVLEEMSVTCERPLDGASAAQKLSSHSFDLVLVDCENLPAAKLIFDVCRRGKNGNNPVPIAIVDGRAGLPTAFRLGAELILTKPVAKDQARNTIRTAVSRVRKEVQTKENVAAQPAGAAMTGAVTTSAVTTGAVTTGAVTTGTVTTGTASEERARAAAASPQLTNFADPAPSFVPSPVPTATLSAPAHVMKMQSAVEEIDASPATPKTNPLSALPSASSSESSLDRAVAADSKTAHPAKPSDDPVLAELERTELEESGLAESQPESSGLEKTEPHQPVTKSVAPIFSSYREGQPKRRSPLIALLMLVLAGAGFYAVWTYQPGFRAIAQPQIDRVLALAGMGLPPSAAPNPAKHSAQPVPARPLVPAPQSSTASNPIPATVVDSTASSAASSATGSAPVSATATAPVPPAAAPGAVVTPAKVGATSAAAPVVAKPEANKPSDAKKDAAAATSPDTQLPGESSAIILSSKGAEKRLAHSVPAQYPRAARDAQGTVVLKEVVDETGKVDGVRLVEGDATLATAAIQAVKQWRYRPYVRDGKAQPFQTIVIVDFQRP